MAIFRASLGSVLPSDLRDKTVLLVLGLLLSTAWIASGIGVLSSRQWSVQLLRGCAVVSLMISVLLAVSYPDAAAAALLYSPFYVAALLATFRPELKALGGKTEA
jgi:hypothetical protein